MPKKSKRNKLADIRIPDSMKKRAVCEHCGKYIGGTWKDPVVSCPSLGKGAHHYECALKVWAKQKEEKYK